MMDMEKAREDGKAILSYIDSLQKLGHLSNRVKHAVGRGVVLSDEKSAFLDSNTGVWLAPEVWSKLVSEGKIDDELLRLPGFGKVLLAELKAAIEKAAPKERMTEQYNHYTEEEQEQIKELLYYFYFSYSYWQGDAPFSVHDMEERVLEFAELVKKAREREK